MPKIEGSVRSASQTKQRLFLWDAGICVCVLIATKGGRDVAPYVGLTPVVRMFTPAISAI